VSRCAVVALAYLMGLMNLSYEEAVKMVSSRRLLSLNHNFVFQLKLYEKMKCKFSKKNKQYSTFLSNLRNEQAAKRGILSKATTHVPKDSQLAGRLTSLVKKQQGTLTHNTYQAKIKINVFPFSESEIKKKNFAKSPRDTDASKIYACANCRHNLFLPQNVVTSDDVEVILFFCNLLGSIRLNLYFVGLE